MTLWLIRPAHGFKPYERINLNVCPCPTILASGDPGEFAYYLEEDGMPLQSAHKRETGVCCSVHVSYSAHSME